MLQLLRALCQALLPLVLLLCLGGCMTRRTRLMEERSALLSERDQMQGSWPRSLAKAKAAKAAKAARPEKDADETQPEESTAERIQKIDERVAEIDVQLLQLR